MCTVSCSHTLLTSFLCTNALTTSGFASSLTVTLIVSTRYDLSTHHKCHYPTATTPSMYPTFLTLSSTSCTSWAGFTFCRRV